MVEYREERRISGEKGLNNFGQYFPSCNCYSCSSIVVVSTTSEKMVCKSNEGNITIMYNDETITGYTASKMSFDLDEQKEIANQIGIEEYLNQFENWFKTNTSGTCTR